MLDVVCGMISRAFVLRPSNQNEVIFFLIGLLWRQVVVLCMFRWFVAQEVQRLLARKQGQTNAHARGSTGIATRFIRELAGLAFSCASLNRLSI